MIPDAAYAVPALEDFRPMPLFALVRFGQVGRDPGRAEAGRELQYTTGMWHWARGLAYLRQGDLGAAEREYAQLAAISQTDAMRELSLASFPKAATLLEIATHVLGGELESARGNTDGAVARLNAAVAIQDGLAYIEPPAWFYPVRHNLGATLLRGRAGRLKRRPSTARTCASTPTTAGRCSGWRRAWERRERLPRRRRHSSSSPRLGSTLTSRRRRLASNRSDSDPVLPSPVERAGRGLVARLPAPLLPPSPG